MPHASTPERREWPHNCLAIYGTAHVRPTGCPKTGGWRNVTLALASTASICRYAFSAHKRAHTHTHIHHTHGAPVDKFHCQGHTSEKFLCSHIAHTNKHTQHAHTSTHMLTYASELVRVLLQACPRQMQVGTVCSWCAAPRCHIVLYKPYLTRFVRAHRTVQSRARTYYTHTHTCQDCNVYLSCLTTSDREGGGGRLFSTMHAKCSACVFLHLSSNK